MKRIILIIALITSTIVNAQLTEVHTPKVKTISRVNDMGVWKASLKVVDGEHHYIAFRNFKYQYIVDIKRIHVGSKEELKALREAILSTIGTKEKRTFVTQYHTIYVIPEGKKWVKIGIYQEYSDNLYTQWMGMRQIKKLIPEEVL